MKSKKEHNEPNKDTKPPKRKISFNRWLVRIFTYLGISLVLFLTILYFSFDYAVKLTIEERFNLKSKGNYKLNIEELKTNFFQQSVEISGLSITPIGMLSDSLYRIEHEEKAIQFELEHGLIKIKDVKDFLLKDNISIATFYFDSPHLTVWNHTHDTLKKDPRLQLQQALKIYTPELMVDSFAINHASIKFHSSHQNGHFTHDVRDLSIYLKEVIINDQANDVDLLFTPIYNVSINDYNYREGIHALKIGNINAKGGHKRITLSDVNYEKEKKAVLQLPLITIVEPQIASYIYQEKIKLDTLLFKNPKIFLQDITHASSTSKSVKENFVKIIEGFTSEIKSNHIAIENADISIQRLGENGEAAKSFQIENLTLKIDETNICEATILDESKVMFSNNILVSFDEFDFTNQKNNATLSLGEFYGEIDDKIQSLNDINFRVPTKMNVSIQSVKIEQMDWRKLWDNQEIDLHTFRVNHPSIKLNTYKENGTKDEIISQVPSLLFENLAYKVDINKLLVNHGQFIQNFHGSSIGIKSQQAKDINVTFRNIHFNKNTHIAKPIKKALHEIKHLSFSDYELIPIHDNYRLYAKKVKIVPQKQELDVSGIRLDVRDQIDLEMSSFKLLGLDWEEYLNTHELAISKVLIKEPEIIADIKPKKNSKKHTDLRKVIPEVLFDFGSSVTVDSVVLDNGFVNIRSGRTNKFIQKADSLSLLITKFVVDSTPQSREHFLFSDDIAFSFKNYELISDASDFKFSADIINVPSSDSLISIKNISLKSSQKDSISVPFLTIKDINWDQFWNEDSLIIKSISIEKPQIHLSTNSTKRHKNNKETLSKIQNIFPHGLVKNLQLNKGSLHLQQDTIGAHSVTQLDLQVEDLVFDSTFMKDGLPMKNLSFIMKDYNFEDNKKSTGIHSDLLKGNTEYGDLSVDNLHFFTDEIDMLTPKVQLSAFELNTFYNNERLVFDQLKFLDSEINYIKNSSFGHSASVKDTFSFIDKLLQRLNGVEGNQVKLINSSVSVVLPYSYHKLNHLNADFNNISITPPHLNCTDRILCSKKVELEFENYIYVNERKLQYLKFDSFKASSIDSLLEIKNFAYSPTMEENEFLDNISHRKTFFSMTSKEIFSTTFNFYELYNSQKLLADKLTIESPNLMISENLKKDRKKKKAAEMPNNIIRDLPFYLNIDALEVHKGNIIYNERAKKGSGTGTIYFTETDALIENITNDKTLMSYDHPAIIRAHSQFMNEGSLSMIMTMPLLEEEFSCEYQGVLGSMDAEIINEIIIPNTNLGLKKGEVRRISFNAKIERGIAEGEMLAKYRSFKVEIYSKNQQRKTILGTLFSNLLISKNNKKKKGKIYYEATPVDSFVKIIWGGIRSGLKDTLLPGFILKKV